MATSATEDLEYNEFYKTLQNQYQALYDRAQDECWLVCIPCTSSLPPPSQISYSFAEAHLLEPSRLLRDEYKVLVGSKRIHWKLNGHILECQELGLEAQVLAEELAYNKRYSPYRMFIIDRPLMKGVQPRKDRGMTKDELLVTRKTLSEHQRLLRCFDKHKEILQELDRRLVMFKDNYMILEAFLSDASKRLESLTKQAFSSFVEEHPTDDRIRDRRVKESVWLALENYIMCNVHKKVYEKICNRYKKEDSQFLDLCRQLRHTFTPSVLNISSDYVCKYHQTLSVLGKFQSYGSPIEKLFCLQDAMDSIYKDVEVHFKTRLRLGEPSLLPSDDLISLLGTILVQANLRNFVSDVYYMEQFHWSPFSEGEKLSYVLVTVRAALEYVRSSDVQKYLPKLQNSPPSGNSPSVTHPGLSSSSSSSLPSALLELHEEQECGLNETLAKLSRLNMEADRIERKQEKIVPKEMGPFFAQLEDGVVSSVQYNS